MKFKVGVSSVSNYTRMNYSLHYAIGELVDNSIQAYIDEKTKLNKIYKKKNKKCEIHITYDRNTNRMTVSDNSSGITYKRLEEALDVGGDIKRKDAENNLGEFNIGMKAASIWMAEKFKIITKRFDEEIETSVLIDTNKLFLGDGDLAPGKKEKNHDEGYTKIEYEGVRKKFSSHQIKKTKEHLQSMYRRWLNKSVFIYFNGEQLFWDEYVLHTDPETNKPYKWVFPKGYIPELDVEMGGWLGILKVGAEGDEVGRAAGPKNGGLALLRRGRVIKGQPEPFLPTSVFTESTRGGLLTQRITGEIEYDDANVSHTKDAISSDDEEIINRFLQGIVDRNKIKKIANGIRVKKSTDPDEELEAINELEETIKKSDIGKRTTTKIPPAEIIENTNDQTISTILKKNTKTFHLGQFIIHLSPTKAGEDAPIISYKKDRGTGSISVVANLQHPYIVMNHISLRDFYLMCVMLVAARYKIQEQNRLTMDDFFAVVDDMMRFEVTEN